MDPLLVYLILLGVIALTAKLAKGQAAKAGIPSKVATVALGLVL
jgi:hypothetical protein